MVPQIALLESLKQRVASPFCKFLAAGSLAACANLSSRFLLTPYIGFELSIVVAYIIGMVIAFALFRTLVFGESGRSVTAESYRFFVVNVVALVMVWCISLGLARILFPAIGLTWHAEDIAHVIGTCVPAISSYFGHSLYTFRANS